MPRLHPRIRTALPITLTEVQVIPASATGLRPGEVVLEARSLAVDAAVVATGLEDQNEAGR